MSAEANDTHLDIDQEWRDIRKHLAEEDDQLVKGLSAEIDGLLILAGLFSAVVTAFVIESYQLLQQNPQDTVVALLTQIAQRLDASAPVTPSMPAAEVFHPPRSVIRFNSTWFLSLSLALVVALFGLVVKQWLLEYSRYHSNSDMTARDQVRLRQHRFDRLKVWRVPQIIMALSLLLQIAVIVFLIGFLDFLWQLNTEVALPSIVVVSLLFMLFVVSIMLAWVSLDCPYRSPLASLILQVLGWISHHVHPHVWFPVKSSWMDRDRYALQKKGIPAPMCLDPVSDDNHMVSDIYESSHDSEPPYTISLDLDALNRTVTSVTDYTRTKVVLTCAVDEGKMALVEAIAGELQCHSYEFKYLGRWRRNAPILQMGVLKTTMVAILEAFPNVLLRVPEFSSGITKKTLLPDCFNAVLALANVHNKLGADQWLRISHNINSVYKTRTEQGHIKYLDLDFIHCCISWVDFCYKRLLAQSDQNHTADKESYAESAIIKSIVESFKTALHGVIDLLTKIDNIIGHGVIPIFHEHILHSSIIDHMKTLLSGTILPCLGNSALNEHLKNSYQNYKVPQLVSFACRNFASIDPALVSHILLLAENPEWNDLKPSFLWAIHCGRILQCIEEEDCILFRDELVDLPEHRWAPTKLIPAFKEGVHATFQSMKVILWYWYKDALPYVSLLLKARMKLATNYGVSVSDHHTDHSEDQDITDIYQELQRRLRHLDDSNKYSDDFSGLTVQFTAALLRFISAVEAAEKQKQQEQLEWLQSFGFGDPPLLGEAPNADQAKTNKPTILSDSDVVGAQGVVDHEPARKTWPIIAGNADEIRGKQEHAETSSHKVPQDSGHSSDIQMPQQPTKTMADQYALNIGEESAVLPHISIEVKDDLDKEEGRVF